MRCTMSYVLKTWVVLQARLLLLLLHHLLMVVRDGRTSGVSHVLVAAVAVLIVVVAPLVREVLRAFMLVCAAILLGRQYPQSRCPTSTVSTHILKSGDRLIDVARRVFVQLLIVAEDDDRDVDGA